MDVHIVRGPNEGAPPSRLMPPETAQRCVTQVYQAQLVTEQCTLLQSTIACGRSKVHAVAHRELPV